MQKNWLLVSVLAVSLILPQLSFAVVEISDGSVKGYYPLDTDSVDYSGIGNNGTDTTIDYGAGYGLVVAGARFNATNGHIELTDTGLDTTTFSIGGWLYLTGRTDWATITNKETSNVNRNWWIGLSPSGGYLGSTQYNLQFLAGNGTTADVFNVYSSTVLALNTWYHFTITHSGTENKIYINGALENTQTYTGTVSTAGNTIRLGGYNGDSGSLRHAGYLDEIFYTNAILSSTQIASLYNAGLGDSICVDLGCASTTTPLFESHLEVLYLLLLTFGFLFAVWIGYKVII